MKTVQSCLLCFERHAQDMCCLAALDEEKTSSVMKTVRAGIAAFPREEPPVKMAIQINELVARAANVDDLYADFKKRTNERCTECVPLLAKTMMESTDPIETAVKLAIAGNTIDCGAHGIQKVSEQDLFETIMTAVQEPIKGSAVAQFNNLIQHSERILYVGDNAGECFFDRPLLELIPSNGLVYAVRGGPVLNDATLPDAHAAGIQERCSIIDTGDNAPGVILERCSDSFRRVFDESDLIISKGQGNYESLSGQCDKTIVFLVKVKCEVIAEDIGFPFGSNVMKILERPKASEARPLPGYGREEIHHV